MTKFTLAVVVRETDWVYSIQYEVFTDSPLRMREIQNNHLLSHDYREKFPPYINIVSHLYAIYSHVTNMISARINYIQIIYIYVDARLSELFVL